MSEHQVTRKVVVRKKVCNTKEKVGITYDELIQLKQWILTGSFNNELSSDLNKLDLNMLHLLRRAVFTEPEQLNKALLDYSQIALKKDTVYISLIFLSLGNFQAKKLFRETFGKIVKTPNDLYRFFSLLRKYRGMGSIIHTTVKKWFSNHDVRELERMFVEERSKHNWSGQDIVRLIKPKARNKEENLILKWLAKDCIEFNDRIDYGNKMPKIWAYETLRTNINTVPVVNMIDGFGLTTNMIPANARNCSAFKRRLIDNMSIEQLLYFLKNNDIVVEAPPIAEKLLDNLKKNKKPLNMDAVEMISVVESCIDNDYVKLAIKLEKFADNSILEHQHSENEILHIVDMNANMYSKLNPYFNITSAMIASVLSSRSENAFTFAGYKKKSSTLREIVEGEGVLENSRKINIDKIGETLTVMPKTVYVWTASDNLKDIERDMGILNIIYSKSNVCLMNMGGAKLTKRNPKYYVISGFNKNTKRLMKLVERGMVI